MLVVDASVVAPVVADQGADGARCRQRLRGERLAVPDLLRVEVLSVLRRQVRTGTITRPQADAAVDDLLALPFIVYPTLSGVGRAWELRDNVTPNDACYLALAEALGCGLLTADKRLAAAPGRRCPVETI